MLIMLLFMPLLAPKAHLFRGHLTAMNMNVSFHSRFFKIDPLLTADHKRWLRPNRDMHRELKVFQGCWWGWEGVGQWEGDNHRSNRGRVPRWSLLVSGRPAFWVQNSRGNWYKYGLCSKGWPYIIPPRVLLLCPTCFRSFFISALSTSFHITSSLRKYLRVRSPAK